MQRRRERVAERVGEGGSGHGARREQPGGQPERQEEPGTCRTLEQRTRRVNVGE